MIGRAAHSVSSPAHAGTHNHRALLFDSTWTQPAQNDVLWLWVPDQRSPQALTRCRRACPGRQQSCGSHFSKTHFSVLATDFVRVLLQTPPSEYRGRREGRALAAPVARLQKSKQAAVTTGLAGIARPSPRDGFTTYTWSPRGPGSLAPVAGEIIPRRLDTSVGVSGPHDFVVRISAVRPREQIARVAKASIASRAQRSW